MTPEARRVYEAKWRAKHRARLQERSREWRKANAAAYRKRERRRYAAKKAARIAAVLKSRKLHWAAYLEYMRRWRKANPDKVNRSRRKGYRRRIAEDLPYRLSKMLRSRLHKLVSGGSKGASAVRDLGCTLPELVQHLQSKFTAGMTWENYGTKGWHIDHIRPLSSFDLTDPEQARAACHYTNLQPLWWHENVRKSDKMPETLAAEKAV